MLATTLKHVLWIGGATDSGKTTLAHQLAELNSWQRFSYDKPSYAIMERKAEMKPMYRAFLDASLDERWVKPTPAELLQFLMQSFQDTHPLILEELFKLPKQPLLVAEGFGFTPDLIAPLLSSKHQGLWLVPTEAFKWASMKRRNKPSFKNETSDPERATQNLFERDMLLAEQIKIQAEQNNVKLVAVDGSLSIAQMVDLALAHFKPYLEDLI